MEILKGFETKGFVEQIHILNKLSNEDVPEAFPGLFSLYNNPLDDKPVDAMVEHTLRALLTKNADAVIKGITHGTQKDKCLCLQVAGLNKFNAAGPAIFQLVKEEKDKTILTQTFLAMAELEDPAFLDLYRQHIRDANELVAAISIERIGIARDQESLPQLQDIINKAQEAQNYERCSLQAGTAIQAISAIGTHQALAFLVDKIHHKNPTARRFIHEELVPHGDKILPLLKKMLKTGDLDQKIMTADVIGRIGSRKGAKILVSAMDRGQGEHPNLRFAIYEALGNIASTTGATFLLDALTHEEDVCLTSVVSSLEKQYTPFMLEKIMEAITSDVVRGKKIIKVIVMAKAVNIFQGLYATVSMAQRITDAILSSNDPIAVAIFRKKLSAMKGSRASSDVQRLAEFRMKKHKYRILAVDDSSSMLIFYRSIGAEWALEVITAENGKVAWELLEAGESVHLIITDMNMPVMDGIEFTRNVREKAFKKDVPIIMVTTESERSQVRLAKNCGVTDFVHKPIKPTVLKNKMGKYLPLILEKNQEK